MKLRNLLSPEEWLVEENEFKINTMNFYETIFCLGNGYLGTRGALEEGRKGELPGTFIAGVFDSHDSMVNEIVNSPDWLPVNILVNGEKLSIGSSQILGYKRILDLKQGLLYRYTKFVDLNGGITTYESLRYTSYANNHLCGIRIAITPENYSGEITVESEVDGDMYNLAETPYTADPNRKRDFHPEVKWDKFAKAKHMRSKMRRREDDICYLEMYTMETNHAIGYSSTLTTTGSVTFKRLRLDLEKVSNILTIDAKRGKTCYFDKMVTIFTSRDVDRDKIQESCIKTMKDEKEKGFNNILLEHTSVWEKKWKYSDIIIKGDPECQKAVRFNMYHLMISAYEKDTRISLGAKTLSGEGYRGHVFWDTEIFMLPFFIYTQPKTARALILYRYNTLDKAVENAKLNGYEGSQFPWESADTGEETTPLWSHDYSERIYTGEEEIHITADVVYGLLSYYTATGDEEFMENYGIKILLRTSQFWVSRVEYNEVLDRYEISKVIGPDEFHEHVNNSAYTNYLLQWNIEKACEIYHKIKNEHKSSIKKLLEELKITEEEVEKWETIAKKIYLSIDEESKLIEQFDGFFDLEHVPIIEYDINDMPIYPPGHNHTTVKTTQLIKQADIVMLMYVLPDHFDYKTKKINYEYYEKRTMHKSSLSPSIYSIMGIEVDDTEKAFTYFKRSAFVDLKNNQGNTENGIHAASTGGTWQIVVNGFGGFRVKDGLMTFKPWLPETFQELIFKLHWKKEIVEVTVRPKEAEFKFLTKPKTGETIVVMNREYTLEAGKVLKVDL